MKKIIIALLIMQTAVQAQTIKVSSGSIHRLISMQSNFVNPRNIDVWLPENYSVDKKYAVLYMHDGQMLFDANSTWNKLEWGVDEHVQNLINIDQIKDVIVVGIWNDDANNNRHPEYFPQKPYESLNASEKKIVTQALKERGRISTSFFPFSDKYLKFIVEELKPYIDKTFPTLTDKDNTFIMGSSMGGLISMYAITEYPTVFGAAACLSTHWPGIFRVENNPIPHHFEEYIKNNLFAKNGSRIYFDYGTETLDALYPALQEKIDAILVQNGFSDENWETKRFEGAKHSESSWNERLDIPLLFLLKK
uniref:alpha/beta hydrolase n=1 Tax=Flavobacterium sp. TaxID=239 RepID=UPI00404A2EDF